VITNESLQYLVEIGKSRHLQKSRRRDGAPPTIALDDGFSSVDWECRSTFAIALHLVSRAASFHGAPAAALILARIYE
jgi:hypothetical protein